MNKKIIISLAVSLTVIGGSSYLIWNSPKNKNEQKKIENSPSPEKKKENNQQIFKEDNHLTSYFPVFFVAFLIFYFLYLNLLLFTIPFDDMASDIKDILYPLDHLRSNEIDFYLIFIKDVLEIIVYEKNVRLINEKNKKNPQELILNFDLQQFLEKFLFGSQAGKDKIRQDAQQFIFQFRKNKLTRVFFNYFLTTIFTSLFSYLSTWIINLLSNFFFHGRKTWKRLKLNSIWKMIPKMKHKHERVMSFILLLLASNGLFLYIFALYFHLIAPKPFCAFIQNNVSRYWLLVHFYIANKDNRLDKIFSDKYNNTDFNQRIKLQISGESIQHRNLDPKLYPLETNFDDSQEIIKQGEQFQTEKFRSFVNDMKKYFDQNDDFEKKVLEKINTFINNKIS